MVIYTMKQMRLKMKKYFSQRMVSRIDECRTENGFWEIGMNIIKTPIEITYLESLHSSHRYHYQYQYR